MKLGTPAATPNATWRVRLARPDDEPELRRLLRERPVPGWVELGFEREPNFHRAAGIKGERHAVLTAVERKTERLIAMHDRSVRQVYVNGQIARLGSLGHLRVDPALSVDPDHYRLLLLGFAESRRVLHRPDELSYDLISTDIPKDNAQGARLTALPQMTPLCDLSTLAIACGKTVAAKSSGLWVRPVTRHDLPALDKFMRSVHPRFQFTPVWRPHKMFGDPLTPGLKPRDFLLAGRGKQLCACLALWDQRAFRQTIVRGYSRKVSTLRNALNPLAKLAGLPQLPKIGAPLRHAWISHMTWRDDDPEALLNLIQHTRVMGAQRDLDAVLLSLTDANPMLEQVTRRFRHLSYRRRLGLVHWHSPAEMNTLLDGRPVHVESAVL